MFKPAELADTKKFFERQGKVIEVKFKDASRLYTGASVLITTNEDLFIWQRAMTDKQLQLAHYLYERYYEEHPDESDTEMLDESQLQQDKDCFHLQPYPSASDTITKPTHKTRFNSDKKVQKTLQCFSTTHAQDKKDVTHEEPKQPFNYHREVTNPQLLQLQEYYTRLFPSELVHQLFQEGFSHKEFSYSYEKNGEYGIRRFDSFSSATHFVNALKQQALANVTNGAVYQDSPRKYKKGQRKDLIPIEAELAFDIDVNDYDDLRQCCQGAVLCNLCWQLVADSVIFLDRLLSQKLRFTQVLWTFSGRRGVHCRVFDTVARRFSNEQRAAVVNFCNSQANIENIPLRLDEQVTKDLKHLIKVPFTIHPATQKPIVPIDPGKVKQFQVDQVPTLTDLLINGSLLEPYFNEMQQFFNRLQSFQQQHQPDQSLTDGERTRILKEYMPQHDPLPVYPLEHQQLASPTDVYSLSIEQATKDESQSLQYRKLIEQQRTYKDYAKQALKHQQRWDLMWHLKSRLVAKDCMKAFWKETMTTVPICKYEENRMSYQVDKIWDDYN